MDHVSGVACVSKDRDENKSLNTSVYYPMIVVWSIMPDIDLPFD